jgi:8-oxo-dGTP diphosphatase
MTTSAQAAQPTLPTLVADAELARSLDRRIVEVAVGILVKTVNGKQHYLLTTRPTGKVYAGYWEFPGGKLEPGEIVLAALQRELVEEIGIEVKDTQIVCQQLVDYPHALVRLNFCLCSSWNGALNMREGQRHSWETLPVSVSPVLPGAQAILEWLVEPAKSTG